MTSLCCNLLSWRAKRPIYHLYLKAYILNYEFFYSLPCPRNLKEGLRSPGPEDSAPSNQPGTQRLVRRNVEAKTRRRKTNEKASNYPQGGRRAPEYLCNFVRKTSNNLWYT